MLLPFRFEHTQLTKNKTNRIERSEIKMARIWFYCSTVMAQSNHRSRDCCLYYLDFSVNVMSGDAYLRGVIKNRSGCVE